MTTSGGVLSRSTLPKELKKHPQPTTEYQTVTMPKLLKMEVKDTNYEEELKVDKTNRDPDASIKAVFTSVKMKVKRKLENEEYGEVQRSNNC